MLHRHQRIAIAAAVTLALTAAAAPSASATPTATTTGPCSEVCSGHGYGFLSPPAVTPVSPGQRSAAAAGVPPTIVRVAYAKPGFVWRDAGIGAGATLGIALAAAGGGLLLVRRRTDSRTAN